MIAAKCQERTFPGDGSKDTMEGRKRLALFDFCAYRQSFGLIYTWARKHVVSQKPVEERESPKPKVYSMTWAQRLKRVFSIEIEKCGGKVKIIASIEERNVAPPEVIARSVSFTVFSQESDPAWVGRCRRILSVMVRKVVNSSYTLPQIF